MKTIEVGKEELGGHPGATAMGGPSPLAQLAHSEGLFACGNGNSQTSGTAQHWGLGLESH